MKLPDVWGEGGLFVFSGMDGVTDWYHPFTGMLLADRLGMGFHTGRGALVLPQNDRREIWLGLVVNGTFCDAFGKDMQLDDRYDNIILSDVLDISLRVKRLPGIKVRLRCCMAEQHALHGDIRIVAERGRTGDLKICLLTYADGMVRTWSEKGMILQENNQGTSVLKLDGAPKGGIAASHSQIRRYFRGQSELRSDVVGFGGLYGILARKGPVRFAYTFSPAGSENAKRKAEAVLPSDIGKRIAPRLAFYRNLPSIATDDDLVKRTYGKSFSVIKANTESPQGDIKFRWVINDRAPHKNLWLWDTAFIAQGCKFISSQLAEDAIKAMLCKQWDDGFIPHMVTPDVAFDSRVTQPPLLAWAAWRIYEYGGNRKFLSYCYPRLKAHVNWDLEHMDANRNGLLEWPLIAGSESGMDNTPRFDRETRIDAVDLNAFVASEMEYLQKIALALKLADDAKMWQEKRTAFGARVSQSFWDKKDRFFYDLSSSGKFVRIKTVASFVPMFAGLCNEEQAQSLVAHLTNKDEFWRPLPVPSVAVNEPTYSDDMWRGPVWMNYNHLIVEGLRRYGYDKVAVELMERTVKHIAYWYGRTGCLFEYYDPEGKTHPRRLRRKGAPGVDEPGKRIGVVRDMNWTGTVNILFALDLFGRREKRS